MYSNGTVAPSTKEYKKVMFTTKELKVESIPENKNGRLNRCISIEVEQEWETIFFRGPH
jgi:hypothetical protein